MHSREDVLCFTSGVLEKPVEVTGPVRATLYVSSSAIDTDFTAKLVDDNRRCTSVVQIRRFTHRSSAFGVV